MVATHPGMLCASTRAFARFRLDTVNEYLWHHRADGNDDRINLTPKAFAVLRYLVENAGRLVRQNEILEAVWPDTFVQPDALKTQILGIRRALGDDPKNPRFIETRPRRGYQFIAPIRDLPVSKTLAVESSPSLLVGQHE